MSSKMRYRLALDLGTTSIGWAMLRLNQHDKPHAVIRAGVRIFNLWNGEVLDAEKSLNVKLPVFSRSCAVRIDFK